MELMLYGSHVSDIGDDNQVLCLQFTPIKYLQEQESCEGVEIKFGPDLRVIVPDSAKLMEDRLLCLIDGNLCELSANDVYDYADTKMHGFRIGG